MKKAIGSLLVIFLLSACSFQVGIEWNGKTNIEDKRYSEPRYTQTQQQEERRR